MITGLVTAKLEAKIGLFIEDSNGQTHAVDATIDTGFSGLMSLPSAVVATLGLTWLHDREVQLVDGSVVRLDLYSAVVIWDGQARNVEIYACDSNPLIGMKMLAGHEVRMRVVDCGPVWIDVVP